MSQTLTQQFALTFVTLLAITYLSNCLSLIVSAIGSTIVLAVISWSAVKYYRRHYVNDTPISSHRKAVLITGCDTGLGNRIAIKLNQLGYLVYATVMDGRSAKQLTADAVFPTKMRAIVMNVTSDEQTRDAYRYVCDDLKSVTDDGYYQLWAVVNNAGVATFGCVDWGTMSSFGDVFDVNLLGVIRVCRTFLPLIRESKGRIVNTSSTLGKYSPPFLSHYSVSKSAVIAFSDALRRESAKWGVRVSTVMPGCFNTGMTAECNIRSLIEKEWQRTDESVRQAYGEKSVESYVNDLLPLYKNKSDNIEMVVDAVIDAIRSREPQLNYLVVGDWMSYLFMTFIDFLPAEWIN